MTNDNTYHSTTANEAGAYRCDECGADAPDHFCKRGVKVSYRAPTPSKPCTEGPMRIRCKNCGQEWDDMPFEHFCEEGVTEAEYPDGLYGIAMELAAPPNCTEAGEHCFCVAEWSAVMEVWQECSRCCWCNVYASYSKQPVPGHGKFRTELVRE